MRDDEKFTRFFAYVVGATRRGELTWAKTRRQKNAETAGSFPSFETVYEGVALKLSKLRVTAPVLTEDGWGGGYGGGTAPGYGNEDGSGDGYSPLPSSIVKEVVRLSFFDEDGDLIWDDEHMPGAEELYSFIRAQLSDVDRKVDTLLERKSQTIKSVA